MDLIKTLCVVRLFSEMEATQFVSFTHSLSHSLPLCLAHDGLSLRIWRVEGHIQVDAGARPPESSDLSKWQSVAVLSLPMQAPHTVGASWEPRLGC